MPFISIVLIAALFFVGTHQSYAQLPSTGANQKPFSVFSQAEKEFYRTNRKGGEKAFLEAANLYKNSGSNDGYLSCKSMEILTMVNNNKLEEAYFEIKETEALFNSDRNSESTIAYFNMALGKYHLAHNENSHALEFYEKALAVARSNPNVIAPVFVIEMEETLGDLYVKQNEKRKAIENFEQVIAAIEKIPEGERDFEELGRQKVQVADLYYELRDIDIAIEKYKEILTQKEVYLKGNRDKEGELLLKIGKSHFRYKEYDVAYPYLVKSLEFNIPSLAKAEAQSMLATIALNLNDYTDAMNKNGAAISIQSKTSGPAVDFFEALMQQGVISKKMPPTPRTEYWYKKSLNPEPTVWSANAELMKFGLPRINHKAKPQLSDNYNIALLFFHRAELLLPKLEKGKQVIRQIEVSMAKGALYYEANLYQQARGYYEKSIELMKGVYPDKHPLVAEATRALSEIYLSEKVFEEAITYVDRAIEAAMGAEGEIDIANLPDITEAKYPYEMLYAVGSKAAILYGMAMKNPTEKNLLEALKVSELGMSLLNDLRRSYRSEGAKYRLSELSERISHQALETSYALYAITSKDAYKVESFDYSESAKSSMLLQSIQQMKAQRVSNVPDSVIAKENRMKVEISYLNGEIYYEIKQGTGLDKERLLELEGKLKETQKAYQKYLEYIEANYKEYFKLKYNYQTVTAEKLQGVLNTNEVMINYVVIDSVIHILVIDKEKIDYKVVPAIELINTNTKGFLLALKGKTVKDYVKYSNVFYERLIAPIEEVFDGRKIIIIPDGALNYIPFEALPTERLKKSLEDDYLVYKELPYLLRKGPITYNYSASLFIAAREKVFPQINPRFLGVAPDFNDLDTISLMSHQNVYSDLVLEPLEYTTIEVNKIAELVNGEVWIGSQTLESRFKAIGGEYSILHFATHGLLNHNHPLYSSLAMMSDSTDDGMLHTFELYNMKLNAELVCLSACNTGVGKIQKGEGAMSIARGFAYAGCPNIAMTLWPVSDQTTQMIMTEFYSLLIQGYDKDEALQLSKLRYLEKSAGIASVPYYWSGLIMVGTPDKIESLASLKPSNIAWYAGGAFAILFLLALAYGFAKKRQEKQTA